MGCIIPNNQINNFDFWEEPEVQEIDFEEVREESEEKFNNMKLDYPALFDCEEIREANPKEKQPNLIDVGMDETVVEYTKVCKGLSCWGVGVCLIVMARGKSEEGPCIALSYNVDLPEERLNELTEKLQQMGCSEESIEFYVIGGQLPHLNEVDEIEDSIEEELKFLELSAQYPIKGVEFNHAEGLEGSLKVYITENEIVWEHTNHDDVVSSEEDEEEVELKRKREDDNDEGDINKKPRLNSFGGLLSGQAPNFV